MTVWLPISLPWESPLKLAADASSSRLSPPPAVTLSKVPAATLSPSPVFCRQPDTGLQEHHPVFLSLQPQGVEWFLDTAISSFITAPFLPSLLLYAHAHCSHGNTSGKCFLCHKFSYSVEIFLLIADKKRRPHMSCHQNGGEGEHNTITNKRIV